MKFTPGKTRKGLVPAGVGQVIQVTDNFIFVKMLAFNDVRTWRHGMGIPCMPAELRPLNKRGLAIELALQALGQ